MDVAPHPHIGLQTVTWLLAGEVAHDDSMGCGGGAAGGVNIMTAGDGIAHAEQTPRDHTGRLNGVQLWTALPDRIGAPRRVGTWPRCLQSSGQAGVVQVFAGTIDGQIAGAILLAAVGADVPVHPRRPLDLPLDPTHEHAALVMTVTARSTARRSRADALLLGTARSDTSFSATRGPRAPHRRPAVPRDDPHVVELRGPTPEEIAQARDDWEGAALRRRVAYNGPRLTAPRLNNSRDQIPSADLGDLELRGRHAFQPTTASHAS